MISFIFTTPSLPGQGDGNHLLHVVAVGLVDFLEDIVECLALRLRPRGGFRNQQGCVHAVLVAHEGGGQEAVALFKAEDKGVIALILELLNLLGDPLEAVSVLKQTRPKLSAILRASSVETTDFTTAPSAGEVTQRLAALEDVIQQHAADLVAGHQVILARVILDGDAHAVAVRIRAEDAVRADFVRQLHGQRERRRIFRVRHLNGGEIRIGQLLLLDDVDILDADFLEMRAPVCCRSHESACRQS